MQIVFLLEYIIYGSTKVRWACLRLTNCCDNYAKDHSSMVSHHKLLSCYAVTNHLFQMIQSRKSYISFPIQMWLTEQIEGKWTCLSFWSVKLQSGSGKTSAIVENSSAPAKNYNPQVKIFKKSLQMPIEDLSILTQRFPFRKPIALTAS